MNKMTEQSLSDPCPVCGEVGHIELNRSATQVMVKGESFDVERTCFHCKVCDESFSTPDMPDHLADAYAAYREKHGLLQPSALKRWRDSLELRQADLAQLLGWSPATISRYENGALQDEAHDRALRLAMTASGLSSLVEAATGLPTQLRQRLAAQAQQQLGGVDQLVDVVAHRTLHDKQEESIHDKWTKVCETVLFFTAGTGVTRTKLNKLLFYSDFLHAKHHDLPITGLDYVKLKYGPVPEHYELIYSAMHAQGLIDIKETLFGEHVGYQHVAKRSCVIDKFSTTEKQVLIKVLSEFEKTSAAEISERSHRESAWKMTGEGEIIPLAAAKDLSTSL